MSDLGHPKTGNTKDVTQQDPTHQQRTYLIGICKDMMSSMDLSREAGLQGLAAETSLVTRKFSSSIFFAGKDYTNIRRARTRTPNTSHSFRMLVLLAKASHSPFIATRGLTRG